MSSFQQGDGGPDHDSYRSGDESGDESGKGKGKGKDEKQKRGINRVNRACVSDQLAIVSNGLVDNGRHCVESKR